MTGTTDDDDTPLRRLDLLERELRQLVARLATVAARSQARLDAIKDSQQ